MIMPEQSHKRRLNSPRQQALNQKQDEIYDKFEIFKKKIQKTDKTEKDYSDIINYMKNYENPIIKRTIVLQSNNISPINQFKFIQKFTLETLQPNQEITEINEDFIFVLEGKLLRTHHQSKSFCTSGQILERNVLQKNAVSEPIHSAISVTKSSIIRIAQIQINVLLKYKLSQIVKLGYAFQQMYQLDRDHVLEFQKYVEVHEYNRGEKLLKQGQDINYIFFIIKGSLKLMVQDGEQNNYELGTLTTQELFGVEQLMSQLTSQYTYVAMSERVCIGKIPVEVFKEYIPTSTQLTIKKNFNLKQQIRQKVFSEKLKYIYNQKKPPSIETNFQTLGSHRIQHKRQIFKNNKILTDRIHNEFTPTDWNVSSARENEQNSRQNLHSSSIQDKQQQSSTEDKKYFHMIKGKANQSPGPKIGSLIYYLKQQQAQTDLKNVANFDKFKFNFGAPVSKSDKIYKQYLVNKVDNFKYCGNMFPQYPPKRSVTDHIFKSDFAPLLVSQTPQARFSSTQAQQEQDYKNISKDEIQRTRCQSQDQVEYRILEKMYNSRFLSPKEVQIRFQAKKDKKRNHTSYERPYFPKSQHFN